MNLRSRINALLRHHDQPNKLVDGAMTFARWATRDANALAKIRDEITRYVRDNPACSQPDVMFSSPTLTGIVRGLRLAPGSVPHFPPDEPIPIFPDDSTPPTTEQTP